MKINKRKVFFINPNFQFSFILHLIFAVGISIFIFYLAEIFFFKEMMREGIEAGLKDDHIYYKLILKQKELMSKVFLITGGVVFLFLIVFGILMSHRIAGPLYKLNNYFLRLAEKEKVPKLHFRKKDFFKELPESFNQVLEAHNIHLEDK